MIKKFRRGQRVYYRFTRGTNLQHVHAAFNDMKGAVGTFVEYGGWDRDECVVYFDEIGRNYNTMDYLLTAHETVCVGSGKLTNNFVTINDENYSMEYLEGLV